MNIVDKINKLEADLFEVPLGATGYNLDMMRFVKKAGQVNYYFHIPEKSWRIYSGPLAESLIHHLHFNEIRELITEAYFLANLPKAQVIYINKRIKEIVSLGEV